MKKGPSLIVSFLTLILIGWLGQGCSASEPPEEKPVATAPPEPAKPEPGSMVQIPAGESRMGTDTTREPPLEAPEHTVNLPAYSIDVYEVTTAEWIGFIRDSGYNAQGDWRRYYSIGKEYHPVTNVIYEDAKAYCEWAGKRLPTEAEWEKAGRGSEGSRFPWGDKWDYTRANCAEIGLANTTEVGGTNGDVSSYGVYDLMGNAQEWTGEKLKPYPESPARRDEAFRKDFIAVRGGSYALKCGAMGLYTRSGYPHNAEYGLGFRCAQDLAAESPEETPEEGN